MKKVLFIISLMMAVLVINAQTNRTPVKVTDLNKAIIDNVAKDYVGFTIREASKVTANNVVTYDVVIAKGATTETLVYDKDGKFVNKMAQTAGTPMNKMNKAAVKTSPKKNK